jgi:hypothetical protein
MDYQTEIIGGEELVFVSTQPGEPYRLFPFGAIYKGGKKREFTPELARAVKLPHFKPAIKLGSHKEETPAGGHIVALEVRADANCLDCFAGKCKVHGLYGVPEHNEAGIEAVRNGAYRYHSPEILWEGGFEDPKTGKLIEGPMIIGDALLHNPHLGEAAALYQSEAISEEVSMAEETVSVPKGFWDKLMDRFDSLFGAKVEPTAPVVTEPVVKPDEFSAVQVERDQFKAEAERLKAEAAAREAEAQATALKAGIVADLQNPEKYGSVWIELPKVQEAADMLASMTEEQRTWCTRNFSALAMQIDESKLTGELGSTGSGASDDPRLKLDAAVKARMGEKGVDYNAALIELRAEKPELFSL